MELKVNGMGCQRCVERIDSALSLVDGVSKVSVDLEKGLVMVEGSANRDSVIDAIESLGYEVDA